MIFFLSLLTCHIFSMHNFSRHFDVKNGLTLKKFENFFKIIVNPNPKKDEFGP
jgi:hypothetical protein